MGRLLDHRVDPATSFGTLSKASNLFAVLVRSNEFFETAPMMRCKKCVFFKRIDALRCRNFGTPPASHGATERRGGWPGDRAGRAHAAIGSRTSTTRTRPVRRRADRLLGGLGPALIVHLQQKPDSSNRDPFWVPIFFPSACALTPSASRHEFLAAGQASTQDLSTSLPSRLRTRCSGKKG